MLTETGWNIYPYKNIYTSRGSGKLDHPGDNSPKQIFFGHFCPVFHAVKHDD